MSRSGHGIVKDRAGEVQPADKKRGDAPTG